MRFVLGCSSSLYLGVELLQRLQMFVNCAAGIADRDFDFGGQEAAAEDYPGQEVCPKADTRSSEPLSPLCSHVMSLGLPCFYIRACMGWYEPPRSGLSSFSPVPSHCGLRPPIAFRRVGTTRTMHPGCSRLILALPAFSRTPAPGTEPPRDARRRPSLHSCMPTLG